MKVQKEMCIFRDVLKIQQIIINPKVRKIDDLNLST